MGGLGGGCLGVAGCHGVWRGTGAGWRFDGALKLAALGEGMQRCAINAHPTARYGGLFPLMSSTIIAQAITTKQTGPITIAATLKSRKCLPAASYSGWKNPIQMKYTSNKTEMNKSFSDAISRSLPTLAFFCCDRTLSVDMMPS